MGIRVLLAEDNALLRQGLERLIEPRRRLELVGSVADLPSLQKAVVEHEPGRRRQRHPDAADQDRRGHPDGRPAARRATGHRRGAAQPARRRRRSPCGCSRAAPAAARYLLKERVGDVGELTAAVKQVAAGGSVIDPTRRRAAGRGQPRPAQDAADHADPARARGARRDGAGQEQRGDRGDPGALRAGHREAHQLDLRQARRSPRSATSTAGSRRSCSTCTSTAPAREASPTAGRGGRHLPAPAAARRHWSRWLHVRVLVVDDQRPFRVAASAVLRRTPGFELVGEAASGEEAVEQVAALAPDLVLMDITMPGIGGVEATRRDHRRCRPRRSCSSARRTPRRTCRPTPSTAGAAAYMSKADAGRRPARPALGRGAALGRRPRPTA